MANTKITTNVIADNAVGITQLNVSDGSNGQFLKTDGSGTLSFGTVNTTTALDDIATGDAASTLATSSGDITIDSPADIILDADGADILLKNGGTHWGSIYTNATPANLYIQNMISDGDIYLSGSDSGSNINALVLDMSDAGTAQFNKEIDLLQSNHLRWKHAAGGTIRGSIDADSNDNLMFYTGSSETERVRIDSAGNVGIGVTNPSDYNNSGDNLVIGSSSHTGITIAAGTSEDSTVFFADGTGGTAGYRGRLKYDHANDSMAFHTAAAERMRIASDGKVGIGTSSPATPLHVVGANGLLLDTEGNGDGSVYFGGISGTDRSYIARSSDDVLFWNVSDGVIRFGTNNAEMMRITSDGVGIGETSPAKLGLTGSSNGKVLHLGGDDCQVRLANTILHHDNSGNTITHLRNNYGATSTSAELSLESGYITFNTGTSFTERVRIAANGRIGVGTTGGNAGLLVSNGDIRTTSAAFANTANSISMSQESAGGFIVARGSGGATRGTITLSVNEDDGGNGIAGLTVNNDGSVSKNSGSFKIDHPLESKKDTHHLVHSFVEAPQADNIYRGKVALSSGSATVNIDTVAGMTEGTFVALNTDVQCFTSNETGWTATKGSVSGNILTITAQDNSCTETISWLIIGERHDQHMKDANWTDENGKIIVEPLKEETYKLDLEG